MKLKLKVMIDLPGTTDKSDFDPEDCLVLVSVEIGPDCEDGGNTFNFIVVTHQYLKRIPGYAWGRALLIVDRFEWEKIGEMVEGLLSSISVDTFDNGIKFISLYMDWEYAGLVDSTGKVQIPASVKVVQSRLTKTSI